MKQHIRSLSIALFSAGALLLLLLTITGAPGLGRAAIAEKVGQSNTPPVADFTIDPPQGVVGTVFFFDPDYSHDNEDSNAWLHARFDFDGDGVWDNEGLNPTNPPERYTYPAAGTYQVKLEIQDTGGLTDTKVIPLQVGDVGSNTAPTADCAVTPSSGPAGTVFTFSAAGSSDAQDATSALKVKWDKWGTFDFRGQSWQPVTQPVTFTYSTNGLHDVDLIVMDSGYLMDDTSCQVEIVPPGGNTPPTATLIITPTSGTITTTFTMDVRGSTDAEDSIADMSVRFDWTDDGVFDTSWLNASQLWTNTFAHDWGQITVRARVKDSGGLTDDATQVIQVSTPYNIYLPVVLRSR
jgi:PKD repeat protein